MSNTKYEMISNFNLTDIDVTNPLSESQDDISTDTRVTPEMLNIFFENRVAEGILRPSV